MSPDLERAVVDRIARAVLWVAGERWTWRVWHGLRRALDQGPAPLERSQEPAELPDALTQLALVCLGLALIGSAVGAWLLPDTDPAVVVLCSAGHLAGMLLVFVIGTSTRS